jgi:hypothetical protein
MVVEPSASLFTVSVRLHMALENFAIRPIWCNAGLPNDAVLDVHLESSICRGCHMGSASCVIAMTERDGQR